MSGDPLAPLEVKSDNDEVTTVTPDPALVERGPDMGQTTDDPEAPEDDLENDDEGPPKKRQHLLPYAPSLAEYFQPLGTHLYRPRPEWLSNDGMVHRFNHQETILHLAIRANATEAALTLIQLEREIIASRYPLRKSLSRYHAASILGLGNDKCVTPLMLASQKGHTSVVQALLQQPLVVDLAKATHDGVTALIQAAHFGHVLIMELLLQSSVSPIQLVEAANAKGTTALMRAAQEGHWGAVELLLRYGAAVHRENRLGMAALLLAAQRGHATICRILLQAGAPVNHKTPQGSTALILACQRGHVAVVRILLAAGCELGLTAQSVVERRIRQSVIAGRHTDSDEEEEERSYPVSVETNQELYQLLDPIAQIQLMQQATRVERNWEMIRMHSLLRQQRAHVISVNMYTVEDVLMDLDGVLDLYNNPNRPILSMEEVESPPSSQLSLPQSLLNPSNEALMRTMALPPPLIQSIASFLPLPKLWTKRIGMLQSTCFVIANVGIFNALDLIDEVLEEGGFLTACDVAQVPPPLPHVSWAAWRRSASLNAPRRIYRVHMPGSNVTESMPPAPQDAAHPTIYELRRQVGYLPLLAQYQSQSNLLSVLTAPPYNMPQPLLRQLIRTSDIASIARRCSISEPSSGVNFEANAALDIVLLASRLCSWYWRERQDD